MRLAEGEQTTVTLAQNPATGYRWELDKTDSTHLSLVRVGDLGFSVTSPPGGKAPVGAGGVHRWRVRALAATRQQPRSTPGGLA